VFRREAVCAADLKELANAIRDGACTHSQRQTRRVGRSAAQDRRATL
jgi:hypothetical protein